MNRSTRLNCGCDGCTAYIQQLYANRRRSPRLAAKPAVNYYEEVEEKEAVIRARDKKAYALDGRSWLDFVKVVRAELGCTYIQAVQQASRRLKGLPTRDRISFIAENAVKAKARAEAAIAKQDAAKARRVERILRRLSEDRPAAQTAPSYPLPKFESDDPEIFELWFYKGQDYIINCVGDCYAIGNTFDEWAGRWNGEKIDDSVPDPKHDDYDEMTTCLHARAWHEGMWRSVPALRRSCASPECSDTCSHCANNMRPEFQEPCPSPPSIPNMFLPPPPTNATVVRVPIDLAQMTNNALLQLIAAAQRALKK